jgi:hypothetical protein
MVERCARSGMAYRKREEDTSILEFTEFISKVKKSSFLLRLKNIRYVRSGRLLEI